MSKRNPQSLRPPAGAGAVLTQTTAPTENGKRCSPPPGGRSQPPRKKGKEETNQSTSAVLPDPQDPQTEMELTESGPESSENDIPYPAAPVSSAAPAVPPAADTPTPAVAPSAGTAAAPAPPTADQGGLRAFALRLLPAIALRVDVAIVKVSEHNPRPPGISTLATQQLETNSRTKMAEWTKGPRHESYHPTDPPFAVLGHVVFDADDATTNDVTRRTRESALVDAITIEHERLTAARQGHAGDPVVVVLDRAFCQRNHAFKVHLFAGAHRLRVMQMIIEAPADQRPDGFLPHLAVNLYSHSLLTDSAALASVAVGSNVAVKVEAISLHVAFLACFKPSASASAPHALVRSKAAVETYTVNVSTRIASSAKIFISFIDMCEKHSPMLTVWRDHVPVSSLVALSLDTLIAQVVKAFNPRGMALIGADFLRHAFAFAQALERALATAGILHLATGFHALRFAAMLQHARFPLLHDGNCYRLHLNAASFRTVLKSSVTFCTTFAGDSESLAPTIKGLTRPTTAKATNELAATFTLKLMTVDDQVWDTLYAELKRLDFTWFAIPDTSPVALPGATIASLFLPNSPHLYEFFLERAVVMFKMVVKPMTEHAAPRFFATTPLKPTSHWNTKKGVRSVDTLVNHIASALGSEATDDPPALAAAHLMLPFKAPHAQLDSASEDPAADTLAAAGSLVKAQSMLSIAFPPDPFFFALASQAFTEHIKSQEGGNTVPKLWESSLMMPVASIPLSVWSHPVHTQLLNTISSAASPAARQRTNQVYRRKLAQPSVAPPPPAPAAAPPGRPRHPPSTSQDHLLLTALLEGLCATPDDTPTAQSRHWQVAATSSAATTLIRNLAALAGDGTSRSTNSTLRRTAEALTRLIDSLPSDDEAEEEGYE